MRIDHCRGGQGERPHQDHHEKNYRKSRHEEESRKRERYSHSHSPAPPRGSREHSFKGESLKRESSSGRNSPMYVDERSRDSVRDERYGRDMELEDSRHRDRQSASSRLMVIREDSRSRVERRGSREQILYERTGYHELKPVRGSSRGGERGGYASLRDERWPGIRGSRSPRRPPEHSERLRPDRHEISSHYSRDSDRDQLRERHHKVREERKEKHHRGHHHRSRKEAIGEERESSNVANVSVASKIQKQDTVNISSGSGEEDEVGAKEESGAEKIEDLIKDLDTSSSSGELSEEESEQEGSARGTKEQGALSNSEESSDGTCRLQHCSPHRMS